jgi:hypothetical protein
MHIENATIPIPGRSGRYRTGSTLFLLCAEFNDSINYAESILSECSAKVAIDLKNLRQVVKAQEVVLIDSLLGELEEGHVGRAAKMATEDDIVSIKTMLAMGT